MLENLETSSVVLLYSAMTVYCIAFVCFVIDLANRSGDAEVHEAELAAKEAKRASRGAGAGAGSEAGSSSASAQGAAGGVVTLERTSAKTGGSRATGAATAAGGSSARSTSLRVGFSLTVLGVLLHLGADILRGIDAGRVPWANMYEFALSATCAIVLIFIVVQFVVDLRFLGALVTGLAVVFLGIAKVNFYVASVPLQPALESYWLVIHILVAVLAVGFLTLSFGLAILQIMQTKREARLAAGEEGGMKFLRSMPNAVRLEDLAYRLAIVGFVFWTFTLIAGAIWAERAWSRFWGWDTKEVWTFVIWVLYAGFIHARATRGWRGTRSAWLNIVAYSAVIFSFTIVNVYFKGLHAYSGL